MATPPTKEQAWEYGQFVMQTPHFQSPQAAAGFVYTNEHSLLAAYECMHCGKSGTHPPGICPEQYKKQAEQEQKRHDDRFQAEAEQRQEPRKNTEQLQQTINIISQQNQANLLITQNVTAMLETITASCSQPQLTISNQFNPQITQRAVPAPKPELIWPPQANNKDRHDTQSDAEEIALSAFLFPLKALPWYLNRIYDSISFTNHDRELVFAAQMEPESTRETLHMIIDSGCTLHLIAKLHWLYNPVETTSTIIGVGNHTVQAIYYGLMLGTLTSTDHHQHAFASMAQFLPNSSISLLSTWRLCNADCEIIHKGNPEHGRHGINLNQKTCQPSRSEQRPFHQISC